MVILSMVDQLRGRINDADSHEGIPAGQWPTYFGETGEVIAGDPTRGLKPARSDKAAAKYTHK